MTDLQKQNGFTPIDNEIMEALAKIRIPGEARQVLDAIIRKTCGWRKPSDEISLSQFEKMTGLARPSICRAINKLLLMKIITKKGNARSLFTKKGKDFTSVYGLQKNHEYWCTLTKTLTSINQKANVEHVNKNVNLTLTKKLLTKESIKEKEYMCHFEEFWEVYPPRNGRKLGKGETQKLFSKIKTTDYGNVVQAAKNYRNSEDVQKGIGIRDPKRFLKNNYWKEWIDARTETRRFDEIGH